MEIQSVKGKLSFEYREVDNALIVKSEEKYEILAQFLMYWNKPAYIVQDLIPLIDTGIKYGRIKYWKTTKKWSGYYIESEDFFLEGINADVVGLAFVMTDTTVIYESDLSLKELKLPSKEFREIVIDWLLFILKNKNLSKM